MKICEICRKHLFHIFEIVIKLHLRLNEQIWKSVWRYRTCKYCFIPFCSLILRLLHFIDLSIRKFLRKAICNTQSIETVKSDYLFHEQNKPNIKNENSYFRIVIKDMVWDTNMTSLKCLKTPIWLPWRHVKTLITSYTVGSQKEAKNKRTFLPLLRWRHDSW